MNTLKKMSAFVLAFMLIFSMCMVSVSAAETETSTATVLYVKPGSNWVQSNPRYAMYLFNSKENTWVDMTDEDGDGYYEAEVPAGDWTSVIFCRMNPAKKDNNWNNKWNQTSDLAIPTDSNCYLVKDGTWDKGGGEWVTYVPGEEPSTAETEPTEAPSYKYTVAGDAGLCGVAWTPASEENALTDEDGDGVYEITYKDVPAGTYSFKVTDGTWNNSWGVGTGNYSINLNDTADVTIKFTEATKKIEVECSALGDFVLKHMTIVGDEGLVGAKWDPKAEEGVMTETEDGIWSITFKNVAAGEYEYKFLANDNYTYNWTVEGYFNSSENSIIKVDNDGADVTLTIDVSAYDFSAKKGSVKATATVAGGTVDPTASTDPTEPTESQPVTVPADQDFYLFGTINGENYGCEEDWESLGDYKFVDGKLSVTFDTVSYVAVKTGDNKGWYMTDGWAGITKSVTLYSTSVLGEDANKLIVPAGKVDFTLTANDDGTLTLSYESENEPEIPTEPATDPTAETDPTESTAAPATKDYYLFGTINGANYGCEDDWKTIGDYKFVDGKLSTTFDTVSYVAVKTGDNAGWYMTDGWQGITKSVTLYSTSKLGEDANKLIVPAGKVDFTLVENADGTLTLSYESENEPVIPTEEPTTEEPTTEEPTTVPSGDVTIKFAAPASYAARYNWSKPVFFYGNSQSMDSAEKLAMTATSEKYYTTEVGSSTLLTTNGWTVFEVKVTAEQAKAIDSAKFAGFATADGVNRTTLVSGSNVLKAGVDTYTAKYGSTVNTIESLNGKTFVIRDSAYGATSSTSFVGYWVSDFVTVRAAAPLAATAYSTWNKVDLYYGNTTAFDAMTKIAMINTGETTKVSSLTGNMTIKTGRWYIFAITLDKSTLAEIESAKYVGFSKADAVNRTAILKNVLYAKTNEFDGNYNAAARTFAELNGQLFVIKGMTAKASSVATYTGEWETEDVYTQGRGDTVTIYFAAPKGVKAYANWDTGVQLYYSNDTVYTNAARLDMKKLDETTNVTVDSSKLTTLKSGEWDIYSVTLTVDQIKAIDDSQSVGFVKTGSFNRTSYTAYRNICKASKMEGDSTYSGVRESIETFDGYMFVINSCYTPSSENVTLTGSWIVK